MDYNKNSALDALSTRKQSLYRPSTQKKSITVDIKNVKMKNAKKWNVERMSSVKGRDSKDLDLSLK